MTPDFLPTMPVSSAEAQSLARFHFGIDGRATPLPGECDANFRIATPEGTSFVLKLMHPDRSPEFVELQARVLEHLASRDPGVQVPTVQRLADQRQHAPVVMPDGTTRVAWMLRWMEGEPLAGARPRHGTVLESLGAFLARMQVALEGFDHPGVHRELKWDLTRAAWIGEHLDLLADGGRRDVVERFLAEYRDQVLPRLPGLRRGVIHGDANDHNVLVQCLRGRAPEVAGLIDFGDMHHGPLVCELAVAGAYALLGADEPVAALARVVAGFHSVMPLTEDEIALVLPLVCMRLCVSVVNSAARSRRGDTDPYATISEAQAWEALGRLAAVPSRLGHYSLRAACGLPAVPHAARVRDWMSRAPRSSRSVLGMDPTVTSTLVLDLSFGSTLLGADPAHVEVEALTALVARAMEAAGASVGIGRYDEARPIYTAPLFAGGSSPLTERRTVHVGMDLFAPAGTAVHSALEGVVEAVAYNPAPQDYGGVMLLKHATPGGDHFYTLYGHLAEIPAGEFPVGSAVGRGQRIGSLGTARINGGWAPHLHFQVITDLLELGTDFPGVVRASSRQVWRDLSPDPAPLLGLPKVSPASESCALIAERRAARIGGNVRLSYQNPVTVVRGWRQYLYDDAGRAYLDVYNNVPLVGHSHPHVVQAIQRQVALLNTNTRYLHDNLVRYAERLTDRMPAPLRTCFILNSASEANELALRLARARTGRRDVIVLEHAYHGHTTNLIAISPYKFDGPGGAGREPWVHVAPIPDDYRGEFRREDVGRGHRYAEAVGTLLEAANAGGHPIGAFIAETLPSVGGQVELPPGYLQDVYRRVRAAGGVCIADEVQVGFGRLGSHFWGFETQDAVPDIVVLGKPIGNGFPLAAVVTTPEIAAAFDAGMEFFSTFGGNPVACAAGLAVLDVLESEGLMENARTVGAHLQYRLHGLAERHALIGDVRGRGLFLGVELVRDRATLEPAAAEATYIVNRLRDLGILCGTDGPHHNVLKVRPPLCFTIADADVFVAVLDQVLGEGPARC